ncbi:MAG: hypothetical protein ACRDNW_23000 [Trebonia sp.]
MRSAEAARSAAAAGTGLRNVAGRTDHPWSVGLAPEPSALDWLREGMKELKALQVPSGLLDPDGELSGVLEISPEAAARLIDFW